MTASPAPNETAYRIGNDNGGETTRTWKEAANTAARWDIGWSQRVRLQVNQPNAANWTPSLRAHIRIGAQANGWNSLPVTQASATTTTASFWVTSSTKEANATQTTATFCGSAGVTASGFQNGNPGFMSTQNPGSAQSALNNKYSEFEWNIKCLTSTRIASTFSFRMTDNGTVLTTYTRYATVVSRSTSVVQVSTSPRMEPGLFVRAW